MSNTIAPHLLDLPFEVELGKVRDATGKAVSFILEDWMKGTHDCAPRAILLVDTLRSLATLIESDTLMMKTRKTSTTSSSPTLPTP